MFDKFKYKFISNNIKKYKNIIFILIYKQNNKINKKLV